VKKQQRRKNTETQDSRPKTQDTRPPAQNRGHPGSVSVLVLFLACFPAFAEAGKYSGGSGEPNDPYRIATAEDLNDIGNRPEDWNKHFILINDVNIADYAGTAFSIIGDISNPFTGVFDGQGHRVRNFTWTSSGTQLIGLFGYVGYGGQIKNLGMENVSINAGNGSYVGGLAGLNYHGTITDCYSTGSISGTGTKVGGLVGCNYSGFSTITGSHFTGSVSGDYEAGGLVGRNYGQITNCDSTGKVTGKIYVGGLVGANYNNGSVSTCYSRANVSGDYDVGGLVGRNCEAGGIADCYSRGSVTGNDEVGGLVGDNYNGTITRCYSVGSVAGLDEVGGLVGVNEFCELICDEWGRCRWECYSGTVTDSFWDIETSGQSESPAGTGKTTAQMKTRSTFTESGWDFVGETANGTQDVWDICETTNYSRFVRQIPRGDFACPDGVDFVDFAILASAWQTVPNDANWNVACDISQPKDNFIDELDLAIFCENWLEGTSP